MSSEWSDMLPVLWTCWSVFPIKLPKRFTNSPWHSGSLPDGCKTNIDLLIDTKTRKFSYPRVCSMSSPVPELSRGVQHCRTVPSARPFLVWMVSRTPLNRSSPETLNQIWNSRYGESWYVHDYMSLVCEVVWPVFPVSIASGLGFKDISDQGYQSASKPFKWYF